MKHLDLELCFSSLLLKFPVASAAFGYAGLLLRKAGRNTLMCVDVLISMRFSTERYLGSRVDTLVTFD